MRILTALALALLTGQGQHGGSEGVPISSRIVSSSVVATWAADNDDAAGTAHLTVLVLWRGQPGWVWSGSFGAATRGLPQQVDEAARHDPSPIGQKITVGATTLRVDIDPSAKLVWIEGERQSFVDNNVFLVDHADGPGRSIRALHIDPRIPAPTQFEAVFRRVAELRTFLQCDIRMPDPDKQTVANLLCAQALGQ
jgi:hypothetical protein